jgi:hypothetical protein
VPPQYLHQLSNKHLSDTYNDRAYLSDGWGDIILIFGGNPKERLKHIFEVQNVLFQDFQVNHTELILTPKCFDAALQKPTLFVLSIAVRIMDNQTLSSRNVDFVKSFYREISKVKITEDKSLKDYITLTRTPGRMDFTAAITKTLPQIKLQEEGFSVYEQLVNCLTINGTIDRLQSNIKIKIQEELSEANSTFTQ